MKIKYSKERINIYYKLGLRFLIVGALMTILFTVFIDSNKLELDSAGIGLIAGGILSLATSYYEKKKHYLTIRNGILTKNSLFQKHINLSEITRIKKIAGDYKLIINKTEFIINTEMIDPHSLTELNVELEKLNLEWD